MTEFGKSIGLVDEAFATVAELARIEEGNLPELMQNVTLSPAVFAQILMNHLPVLDFNNANKRFWMEVGVELGGDNIVALKKVAAFAEKTWEF